jgi:hypothetical protein
MSYVEGLDDALKEINEAVADVKEKSQAGFWEAGLKILNASMKNLKDSVITGNLRASAYARPAKGIPYRPEPDRLDTGQNEPIPGDNIGELGVEIGFTAVYALNVHENIEGARTPKYLERPVMQNVDNIVRIIKSRAGAEP